MNICRFDNLKHHKIGSSYTQRYEKYLIYANISNGILVKNTKKLRRSACSIRKP